MFLVIYVNVTVIMGCPGLYIQISHCNKKYAASASVNNRIVQVNVHSLLLLAICNFLTRCCLDLLALFSDSVSVGILFRDLR